MTRATVSLIAHTAAAATISADVAVVIITNLQQYITTKHFHQTRLPGTIVIIIMETKLQLGRRDILSNKMTQFYYYRSACVCYLVPGPATQ